MLDFSAKSARKAPLVFISSVSSSLDWLNKHPNQKLPEEIIHDYDAPEYLGYGESKFVSELLIEKYSKVARITTAILRTGQIAGALKDKNFWNR